MNSRIVLTLNVQMSCRIVVSVVAMSTMLMSGITQAQTPSTNSIIEAIFTNTIRNFGDYRDIPPIAFRQPSQPVYTNFVPPKDGLRLVTPEWVVWLTREMLPGQQNMHAPLYRWCYIIQRWVGADAICIAETTDTDHIVPYPVVGASSKGSLLFENPFTNSKTFWIVRSSYETELTPKFRGEITEFVQHSVVYYRLKRRTQSDLNRQEEQFDLWAEGYLGKGLLDGDAIRLATLTAKDRDLENMRKRNSADWLTFRHVFPIIFRQGSPFFQVWDGAEWKTIWQPYPKTDDKEKSTQPSARPYGSPAAGSPAGQP